MAGHCIPEHVEAPGPAVVKPGLGQGVQVKLLLAGPPGETEPSGHCRQFSPALPGKHTAGSNVGRRVHGVCVK